MLAGFDVVVSRAARHPQAGARVLRVGVRAAAVDAVECVFLDDLCVNLKPAKAMGMATIKVGDLAWRSPSWSRCSASGCAHRRSGVAPTRPRPRYVLSSMTLPLGSAIFTTSSPLNVGSVAVASGVSQTTSATALSRSATARISSAEG